MKGVFITFEGVDGCGKTTQLELLAAHLRRQHYNVVATREPGGTAVGDRIRRILLDPAHQNITPLTELLLYAASRAQHLHQVILPALERGDVVLCDRYTDATDAYQGGARGIDQHKIAEIHHISTAGVVPQLTILLDSPVDQALSRAVSRMKKIQNQREARFEQEQESFHRRVREAYLAIARHHPERIKIIDATGTIDAIHQRIVALIAEVLPPCGIPS